jgi:hypothetical protein
MSYTTLVQQVGEVAFTNRIQAAAMKETFANEELGNSTFGQQLMLSPSQSIQLNWPVSIATEQQYAYAVQIGNPNPGGDPAVITDADILAAVQANWPQDPPAGSET